ncbi:MAG: ATP-binding protein [Candidatus Sumerlaeota bacterium]|nr:ATP-binding protein [Candidatus Sumerlaeota bacterium]
MLIEFQVANFRSIRETQTLSLVASNADKELPENVIDHQLPGLAGLKYLKGAALYGANASGKSNLINAIRFASQFVQHSAIKLEPDDPTGIVPFKLDASSASKPSEFEMTFVADGTRYVFGMALDSKRVLEEYLIAFPKGQPQRWYERLYDEKKRAYKWDTSAAHFQRDSSLEAKTRDNCLFLSMSSQFNHPQMKPIYSWFKSSLRFLFLGAESSLSGAYTASLLTNKRDRDRIIRLLQYADLGIAGIRTERQKNAVKDTKNGLSSSVFKKALDEFGPEAVVAEITRVILLHQKNGHKAVEFAEDEESAGTHRFFALLGPWLDILDHGRVVFIDEIDASLHPLLIIELIKMIFSRELNPLGAQIVFTAHNPVFLDVSLLRRDQVWFTEKAPSGATDLYPLTDYQPRKGEALMKGYLVGRYGGVPFIPKGLAL